MKKIKWLKMDVGSYQPTPCGRINWSGWNQSFNSSQCVGFFTAHDEDRATKIYSARALYKHTDKGFVRRNRIWRALQLIWYGWVRAKQYGHMQVRVSVRLADLVGGAGKAILDDAYSQGLEIAQSNCDYYEKHKCWPSVQRAEIIPLLFE